MSIWDTVTQWASDAASKADDIVSSLPGAVFPLAGLYQSAPAAWNTFTDLLNPADTRSATEIARTNTYQAIKGDPTVRAAEVAYQAAGSVADTVAGAASSVGDALGLTPGSVPLSIKLAVAASVVIGVYIMISGHRRYVS